MVNELFVVLDLFLGLLDAVLQVAQGVGATFELRGARVDQRLGLAHLLLDLDAVVV